MISPFIWQALSVSLLGAGGVGLIASALEDRDWKALAWGAGAFALAIIGIGIRY